MIYKYEMACKEAGMTEEQIAQIRREFDRDYKQLKRENKAKEEEKIEVFSTEALGGRGEDDSFDIEDTSVNIEEMFIHQWELERLRELMAKLSEEDRDFLYDCFSGQRNMEQRIAEKYGLNRNQLQYKRACLINRLRKGFEE